MGRLEALGGRIRAWLAHRYLPLHLAGLGMLLCLPALGLGWHTDDHVHRAILTGLPGLDDNARAVPELFVFVRSETGEIQRQIDLGILPWWTSDELHLAFFRPLSAATHWLDYRLWPERLFRSQPTSLGDGRELTGVSVEVTALTRDGRPGEATFRFERALEHPAFRWLQWNDGRYVPFPLPAVGETVRLDAVTVPFFADPG